ncbi:MAG: type II toxin-antitoxin system PemK/MazF family toxin [Deltaproteobacteria bacterium]|nr:MAG: type II toxin-antitoxin system PemK/MazF family toxin [Deltaproteobacteria bacterium]
MERIYPFEAAVARNAGVRKSSKAMANQIRTVSKERLLRRLGKLPAEKMSAIDDAILLHLGTER